jgi:hypothetical protein
LLAANQLIATCGVEKAFQIHASHRHRPLPDNHVLVGAYVPHLRCYWSIPTAIEQVLGDEELYGNVFAIDDGKWIATELLRGPPTILTTRETEFLRQYSDLVIRQGLTSFGLRLASLPTDMVEFCFNPGVLLVNKQILRGDWSGLQYTCWRTVIEDNKVSYEESLACYPNLQGGHDVKEEEEIWTADEAMQYLREEGIIKEDGN